MDALALVGDAGIVGKPGREGVAGGAAEGAGVDDLAHALVVIARKKI